MDKKAAWSFICLYLLCGYLLVFAKPLDAGLVSPIKPSPPEEKVVEPVPCPSHISYLMQVKQYVPAIELYLKYRNARGAHDFELLEQLAYIILESGARSSHPHIQLLSIYGSSFAGALAPLDILESGLKSEHSQNQSAAIQYLGRIEDDRTDELLLKAMSSPFFSSRVEAAFYLAQRKHKSSVGHIESLMYRVPPFVRFFFPQFFALVGSPEAISILRHLMEDPNSNVRVEAILSAARFGRDDLLTQIRSGLTHQDAAEQEAATFALGLFKDAHSIKRLEKLLQHPCDDVALAAAKALYTMGKKEVLITLIRHAEKKHLFAIAALGDINAGTECLATLCRDTDLAVRLNAGFALIKHKDIRALPVLLEFLQTQTRDMGLIPYLSTGRTMVAFKPLFSITQQSSGQQDVKGMNVMIKEMLLTQTSLLGDDHFLCLAKKLFDSKELSLIPHIVHLLANLQTPASLALLRQVAQEVGMPLLRTYASLSLYKLGDVGLYEPILQEWVTQHRSNHMFEFRPVVPLDQRSHETPYELTLEHHSQLLLEIISALAEKKRSCGIDIILDSMQASHPNNIYLLAGLLLHIMG